VELNQRILKLAGGSGINSVQEGRCPRCATRQKSAKSKDPNYEPVSCVIGMSSSRLDWTRRGGKSNRNRTQDTTIKCAAAAPLCENASLEKFFTHDGRTKI